jgi:hypothetical protein
MCKDGNERRKVSIIIWTPDSASSNHVGESASFWTMSKKPKDNFQLLSNSCSHPFTLHLGEKVQWRTKHQGWYVWLHDATHMSLQW